MKPTLPELMLVVGLLVAASGAHAQTPPAPDEKARERAQAVRDAEPAVTPAVTPPAATPAAKAPAAKAPAAKAPAAKAPAAERAAKAQDRLDLETTQITGNRELPKVMVVVPWKRSDIGDLAGRPVNSLVDEALQPVDREVFRREIDYYGALAPDRPRDETHVTAGAAEQRPEK
jgi:hypothetical protein